MSHVVGKVHRRFKQGTMGWSGAAPAPMPHVRAILHGSRVQAKLKIGAVNDPAEAEADRVADRVMRMPVPGAIGGAQTGIQRKCAECVAGEDSPATASLQTIEGGEEELSESLVAVQRKVDFGGAVAASSPTIADRLAGAQSSGELLAPATRYSMETAFGRDFSRVRVHRDGEAAELSHQLSALAFTHGNHIYFGSGNYDPSGSSGKRLLAHELTHVAQQGQAVLKSGGDAAPTATAVQRTPPAIQRVANWAAAAVHETNNLADTALFGVPAGVTLPILNGNMGAAIGAALNAPTLTVAPVVVWGWPPKIVFDATVATVPANTGSADETVLAAGPWRRVTPKATIAAVFPALAQCARAGNSNFRARGRPSDAAMFAANRRHEDRHAADGLAAFNGSVVPWDTRLTAARAAGTRFQGPTAAAARTALFTAMGGTPVQVRNAFVVAWNAAIPIYHATPTGGGISAPTDPVAAPFCGWSFARYTNPS